MYTMLFLICSELASGKMMSNLREFIACHKISFDYQSQLEKEHREDLKKEEDAENISFRDNQFDTVVTSCVFCSVPDPVRGLKEIRRVCRNGGKILMLEHVRSSISTRPSAAQIEPVAIPY